MTNGCIHYGCKVGYECFFCSKLYKTPFKHRQHLKRKHGEDCDLTTPPPTGRFDPRHSAQAVIPYLPPIEARLAPQLPKRPKSQTVMTSDTSSTFDWEKELYTALNDEIISDTPRPISPISPPTKEFGVQVRKRDFLTTSRDTQTEQVLHSPIPKVLINQSTQTAHSGIDSETQTDVKEAVNAVCQTIKSTIDQNCQADFFNAGLITHTLMDAIKSIAPYVKPTTSTQRQVMPVTPSTNPNPTNEPARRRGRPRRHPLSTNNTPEDPILL